MYKYKVLTLKAASCEKTLNKYARDGWQVISMIGTNEKEPKAIVTFEREIEDDDYEDEDFDNRLAFSFNRASIIKLR